MPQDSSPPLPSVTAIVLNWDGCKDTLTCVASLRRQTYSNLTILVVDNGSFDGALEAVEREFPGVRTLQLQENLGYTGGNNAGMSYALEAGAELLFLVNNDVTLDREAVAALVEVAQQDPKAAALGPTVYVMDQPTVVQSSGGSFNSWTGRSHFLTDQPALAYRRVDWVSGAAIMLRADALRSIGLLEDRFFAYCEELDWCLRALGEGYHVLHVPAARVWHRVSSTSPALLQYFLFTRNDIWVTVRHCHGVRLLTALPYRVLVGMPHRSLRALADGNRDAAVVMAQGLLWHLGMFRRNNPLVRLQRR